MPEECFEKLKEIKEKAEREKESKPKECLRCGAGKVVRNGKRNGRQAYLCGDCGKTVWKQVIQNTLDGVSIDKTVDALDLSRSTVFHMRHKILYCVEQAALNTPGMLEGVCEADETYVLESEQVRFVRRVYLRMHQR